MLRLALSQLRDQPRRYVSVLLAIVIGVTFLASALLVGSSSTASLRNSLGATYSRADLVIAPAPDREHGASHEHGSENTYRSRTNQHLASHECSSFLSVPLAAVKAARGMGF